MEKAEILRLIDDGANYYLRLLGDAQHMEYCSNEYYAMIRPRPSEEGGTSLFEVRLEHLPEEVIAQKVAEIKQLNVHTWWGLCQPENVLEAIWKGQQRPQPQPEPNDEEAYMALLPEEKPAYDYAIPSVTVKKVNSAEDFKIWARISNTVLHGGYPIMHPENHYHLCEKGIMPGYVGYYENTPAAVAAIMHNGAISSLEFVATLQEYQRKGLGKAVCMKAIDDAFQNGSKIITLRSTPEAKRLYVSVGFKFY